MHGFPLRRVVLGVLSLAALILLTGCTAQPDDVLAKAYVAPASLNVRRQLTQKNDSAAVLKHGDPVSIIDVRRRFVKVRTANGIEGWVDSYNLLSQEQMDQIKRERKEALSLPSEGQATAYEPLNVHIAPDRRSPAFTQIPEGGAVAILAHRIEPKATGAATKPTFIIERPQPARKPRKDRQSRASLHLPPRPAPPKAPANWQEISAERIDNSESPIDAKAEQEKKPDEKKPKEPEKPVVMEAWSLIRTKNNQVGWVLSRNVSMSIPDEVAQYAEGKRITSYFDLGAVEDEEKGAKHNWLWTTASSLEPFDFDSWRVFLWNRRRHRYETSYRQRDVEGYFPVQVDPADANAFGRTFHLITKDDDGKLRRRDYFFDGTRVHLSGTQDYGQAVAGDKAKPQKLDATKVQGKSRGGWLRRQWNSLKSRFSGS